MFELLADAKNFLMAPQESEVVVRIKHNSLDYLPSTKKMFYWLKYRTESMNQDMVFGIKLSVDQSY